MKTLQLFILGLTLSLSASAQITLTEATSVPNIGESYAYVLGTVNGNVNQGGANQTWDMTSITGTAYTYNYIDLSNSLEPATFPTANIVESVGGASDGYLTRTSSDYSYVGNYAPGQYRMIYTDPRKYLIFPMNYNDVFTDTWSGTVENIQAGQTFNRSGSTEITADGHGTLILPTGTVLDVLRVRAVANYEDEYQGFPIYTYTDTIYTWYEAGTNNFIASHSVSWANFSLFAKYAYYMDNSLVSIDDQATANSEFSIYPNPAQDFVQMNGTGQVYELQISDMSGKLVRKIDFSQNDQTGFSVSDLPNGIYIITCIAENGTHSKRLVIE